MFVSCSPENESTVKVISTELPNGSIQFKWNDTNIETSAIEAIRFENGLNARVTGYTIQTTQSADVNSTRFLSIYAENNTGSTVYNLGNVLYSNGGYGYITFLPNVQQNGVYYSSINNTNLSDQSVHGMLNLTAVDTQKREISGTFQSDVFYTNTTTSTVIDQKNISNGRFDQLHYKFRNNTNAMTAQINGSAFTADYTLTSLQNSTITIENRSYQLKTSLFIEIPASISIGSVAFSATSSVKAYLKNEGIIIPLTAGSLQIDSLTGTNVSGTLNGTTSNGLRIENVVFNLKY
ncbi:MAG: hypothetical protein CFE24_12540 [Flavobacterium sp. BFFFF2]|nr:MAG: hypothetical protein CFE24_12540 [Flavobacterium sp. BFFFF2]